MGNQLSLFAGLASGFYFGNRMLQVLPSYTPNTMYYNMFQFSNGCHMYDFAKFGSLSLIAVLVGPLYFSTKLVFSLGTNISLDSLPMWFSIGYVGGTASRLISFE